MVACVLVGFMGGSIVHSEPYVIAKKSVNSIDSKCSYATCILVPRLIVPLRLPRPLLYLAHLAPHDFIVFFFFFHSIPDLPILDPWSLIPDPRSSILVSQSWFSRKPKRTKLGARLLYYPWLKEHCNSKFVVPWNNFCSFLVRTKERILSLVLIN